MTERRIPTIVKWLAVPAVLLAGFIAFIIWFGFATKQYYYAAFGSDEYNLTVRSWNTAGIRYALIEIVDNDDDSYVLLEAPELDHAIRMFETAKAQQSSNWHDVGDMAESHEKNPAHLTVAAGPGIRFAIRDGGVCLSYDLPPVDFATFENAAMRARKHFENDEANQGIPSGYVFGDVPPAAFQSLDKAMSAPAKHTNQGCH